MTNIRTDLKKYFDENLDDLVENHLETWRDRYATMGTSAILYDLQVNYDWSADYEIVENEIGRKLTPNEQVLFEQKFKSAVKRARR